MNRHITGIAIALVALIAVSGSALAQGVHEHDGFFLRLSTGAGSSTSTEDIQGTKFGYEGGCGQGSFAIGYAVAPNFILNVDMFGNLVTDPTVTIDGVEFGEAKDVEVETTGFGVGATYYFMPVNIYVAGSFGFGETTAKYKGNESTTDPGYAANLMAGKEWWVSDNWGLGAALQVVWASVPDKGEGKTYTLNTTSVGVLFTATYN